MIAVVGAVLAAGLLVLGGIFVMVLGLAGVGASAGSSVASIEPTAALGVPPPVTAITAPTAVSGGQRMATGMNAPPAPSPAAPASSPAAAMTATTVSAPPTANPPFDQAPASRGAALQQPSPPTGASSAGAAAPQASRQIAVYFSRRPQSDADMSAVFPVPRTVDSPAVARAAILALMAGPTPEESAAGYFSELGGSLMGPSACGDERISIAIENGIASLRFCQDFRSGGIGQDARMMSSIITTLRQFPTIQRVRVLTKDGHCMFDMSGEDRCLRDR
jgi:hypothetical protein